MDEVQTSYKEPSTVDRLIEESGDQFLNIDFLRRAQDEARRALMFLVGVEDFGG